jgi:glycosyltransferase involved in cell wall biosynthesis
MTENSCDLPTIVQVGPGLAVRGGVSAVEQLILESVGQRTPVEHVTTMKDGNLFLRLWVFLQSLYRIRTMLRQRQPLLFHVHFASRGSTLRKYVISRMVSRSSSKLILHAHGAAFDSFFAALPKLFQKRVAQALSNSDGFIALSSQWQEFYAMTVGLPAEKISILINPVKLPEALPDRGSEELVQFLFLGRIDDRKGAFDLLKAYQALPPPARARSRVVFAGDGRVDELRALACQVGPDVIVHSWLDSEERDRLLAASDVLVLPSRQEGVPMAILEAMSYGMPVVATPVGGIPDVIAHEREGLLVDVGDQAALTAAMARLAFDAELRLSLGSAARAKAESLDVAHYSDRLLRLYHSVIMKEPEPVAVIRDRQE